MRLFDQAAVRNDEDRLQFCRDIGICIVSGKVGHVDPAHTRFADSFFNKFDAGVSLKPLDIYTLPLSRSMHESQHSEGEREWWTRMGFPALSITKGPLAAGLIITGFYQVGNFEGARTWVRERAKLSLAERQ